MEILLVLLLSLVFFILLFIILFIIQSIKIRNLSKSLRNNVHFYVARDKSGSLWLYMGKPIRLEEFFARGRGEILLSSDSFPKFGLNVNDYANLKWEDEPVEVFLNLEN